MDQVRVTMKRDGTRRDWTGEIRVKVGVGNQGWYYGGVCFSSSGLPVQRHMIMVIYGVLMRPMSYSTV